jgi:uncharacterized surface protein with fasciclin (FAS1) repeats
MARTAQLLPILLIALLSISFAAPADAQRSHADLIDVARSAGSFQTLLAAVEAAGLTEALQDPGPFTVFAPTDDAFARLPEGTVESLLEPENRDRLRAILMYHVVPARVSAAQASALRFTGTLNGQRLSIQPANGGLSIGNSSVIQADIVAENGVIHVIDQVLLPQEQSLVGVAAGAGEFSTLLAAAQAAGLAEALATDGPFTVFAPTDAAFEALPAGTVESLLREENLDQLQAILKLHVVPSRVYADQALQAGSAQTLNGENIDFGLSDAALRVNGVSIVTADLEASNGVIHVIDKVLLPQALPMASNRADSLIRLAIDRGVPLFNRGDADACAAIYEVAMRALVDLGDLPRQTREDFRRTLRQAAEMQGAQDRAWALRNAFDRALATMASAVQPS